MRPERSRFTPESAVEEPKVNIELVVEDKVKKELVPEMAVVEAKPRTA